MDTFFEAIFQHVVDRGPMRDDFVHVLHAASVTCKELHALLTGDSRFHYVIFYELRRLRESFDCASDATRFFLWGCGNHIRFESMRVPSITSKSCQKAVFSTLKTIVEHHSHLARVIDERTDETSCRDPSIPKALRDALPTALPWHVGKFILRIAVDTQYLGSLVVNGRPLAKRCGNLACRRVFIRRQQSATSNDWLAPLDWACACTPPLESQRSEDYFCSQGCRDEWVADLKRRLLPTDTFDCAPTGRQAERVGKERVPAELRAALQRNMDCETLIRRFEQTLDVAPSKVVRQQLIDAARAFQIRSLNMDAAILFLANGFAGTQLRDQAALPGSKRKWRASASGEFGPTLRKLRQLHDAHQPKGKILTTMAACPFVNRLKTLHLTLL